MENFMHCPKCGQKQGLNETSFCSKCGFEISDVKDLLITGTTGTRSELKKKRKKATKQGLIMIFFGLSLVMILAALKDTFSIPKIVIIIPLVIFMIGGVMRMMFAQLSDEIRTGEDDAGKSDSGTGARKLSDAKSRGNSLPEAEYRPPLDLETRTFDTSELKTPSSVTEETTKLLEKQITQE
ncbi:MAG: zinc ribbon domain-containing protein [Pyrinomonadaceae bacterium]